MQMHSSEDFAFGMKPPLGDARLALSLALDSSILSRCRAAYIGQVHFEFEERY